MEGNRNRKETKKEYQHKDKSVMENGRKDEGKKAYGDGKESGHATWSVVSSNMSVEGRHLRALNSLKIRPNA